MATRKPHPISPVRFPFFFPLSSSSPSPASAPATRISPRPSPERAGNAARAGSDRAEAIHLTASARLPNFFFSFLSLLQIAIPQSKHIPFSLFPVLAHRRRCRSTLQSPPPPPRQVKPRALSPSIDRELRPALFSTRRPRACGLDVGGGVGLGGLGFE